MTTFVAATIVVLLGNVAPTVSQEPGRSSPEHGITIRDAWVRASTSLRNSSSGYCRIENATGRPVALLRITADGVGQAQVHTMADHDGQMQMHPVAKLTIPPHGAVDLAPGGTHVMLTDIRRPLAVGSSLEMQFAFDDGRTRTVRATVRPLDAVGIR